MSNWHIVICLSISFFFMSEGLLWSVRRDGTNSFICI